MNDKHINVGGPAFPEVRIRAGDNYNAPVKLYYGGMSMRDYFAAKAMQGFCADPNMPNLERCARLAYEMADAMIKAREAGNG